MSTRIQTWLFSILIILLCVSLYTMTRPEKKIITPSTDNLPESFAHHIKMYQYDKQGLLQQIIQSPLAKNYENPDKTTFLHPSITGYDKNRIPWHVTSQYALAHKNFKQIDFQGQVILHQAAHEARPASKLLTESLHYWPKTQQAASKEQVDFYQPGLHISALGMQADLANKTIQLQQQARGTYVPKPS